MIFILSGKTCSSSKSKTTMEAILTTTVTTILLLSSLSRGSDDVYGGSEAPSIDTINEDNEQGGVYLGTYTPVVDDDDTNNNINEGTSSTLIALCGMKREGCVSLPQECVDTYLRSGGKDGHGMNNCSRGKGNLNKSVEIGRLSQIGTTEQQFLYGNRGFISVSDPTENGNQGKLLCLGSTLKEFHDDPWMDQQTYEERVYLMTLQDCPPNYYAADDADDGTSNYDDGDNYNGSNNLIHRHMRFLVERNSGLIRSLTPVFDPERNDVSLTKPYCMSMEIINEVEDDLDEEKEEEEETETETSNNKYDDRYEGTQIVLKRCDENDPNQQFYQFGQSRSFLVSLRNQYDYSIDEYIELAYHIGTDVLLDEDEVLISSSSDIDTTATIEAVTSRSDTSSSSSSKTSLSSLWYDTNSKETEKKNYEEEEPNENESQSTTKGLSSLWYDQKDNNSNNNNEEEEEDEESNVSIVGGGSIKHDDIRIVITDDKNVVKSAVGIFLVTGDVLKISIRLSGIVPGTQYKYAAHILSSMYNDIDSSNGNGIVPSSSPPQPISSSDAITVTDENNIYNYEPTATVQEEEKTTEKPTTEPLMVATTHTLTKDTASNDDSHYSFPQTPPPYNHNKDSGNNDDSNEDASSSSSPNNLNEKMMMIDNDEGDGMTMMMINNGNDATLSLLTIVIGSVLGFTALMFAGYFVLQCYDRHNSKSSSSSSKADNDENVLTASAVKRSSFNTKPYLIDHHHDNNSNSSSTEEEEEDDSNEGDEDSFDDEIL